MRKKASAKDRLTFKPLTRNPKKTRTEGYNADAVNKAIAASTRAGKRIGSKEAKLIHSLLRGRTATKNPAKKRRTKKRPVKRKISRVARNPYKAHYIAVRDLQGKRLYLSAGENSFIPEKKYAYEFPNRIQAYHYFQRIKAKIARNNKIRDAWIVT